MYTVTSVRSAGNAFGVAFDLSVDDGPVQHFIVVSAVLSDLTGSKVQLLDGALVEAFHKVGSRVCEVAAAKYGQPSTGQIVLTSFDFPGARARR